MTDGKSQTQQRFEQDDANEVYDASQHWPVLKRPSVAGSNAPRDKFFEGQPVGDNRQHSFVIGCQARSRYAETG
jgi:hypothetical protein